MAAITTQWTLIDRVSQQMNKAVDSISGSEMAVDSLMKATASPISLDINTAKLDSARALFSATVNEMNAQKEVMSAIESKIQGASDSYNNAYNSAELYRSKIAEIRATARGDLTASAAKQVDDLSAKMRNATTETSKFSAQMATHGSALAKAETKYAQLSNKAVQAGQSVKKLDSEYKAAASSTEQLSGKTNKLSDRFKSLFNRMRGVEPKQLSQQFNGVGSSADTLGGKIDSLVKKFIGFQAVKAAVRGAMNFIKNAFQAGMESNMNAVSIGSALGEDVGKAYANKLRKTAGSFDYGKLLGNTKMFASYTKNLNLLDEFNRQAKQLSTIDPTQGLDGAGFAIKEMLGGDFISMKGRFGMSGEDINSIKEGAKTYQDLIDNFDKWLDKRGAGSEALKRYEESDAAIADTARNKLMARFSDIGESILSQVAPALSKFNEWMDSEQANIFFANVANGISWIVGGLIQLAEIGATAFNWITENADTIAVVLAGVVAGVIAYKIATFASGVASLFAGGAAMSAAGSFILLGVAVAAGIIALVLLMRQFEGVRSVVAGVASAIVGIFQIAVGLVISAFEMMANAVISIINGILGGVNLVIGGLNKIPGVDISPIAEIPKANFGGKDWIDKGMDFGGRYDRYKSGLDDYVGKDGDKGLNALGSKLGELGDKFTGGFDGLSNSTDEIADWTGAGSGGGGGGSGGGGGGGAPVRVTNDEFSEEMRKFLREKEESAIMRSQYVSHHQDIYITDNDFTVNENGDPEELYEHIGRRIQEDSQKSPNTPYGREPVL